ncbi:hypothetical protein ACFL1I_00995 [Candidatus Omnitrophota bacterium]
MAKDQMELCVKNDQKAMQALKNCKHSKIKLKDCRVPTDLIVKFPTGTKWSVRVKPLQGNVVFTPNIKELACLEHSADCLNSTPVVANVGAEEISYFSARSGRNLTPPKTKKGK